MTERINIDDIRAKGRQVEEVVNETRQTAKTSAIGAIGALSVLLLVVYILGRRRGKQDHAVIEVYKV